MPESPPTRSLDCQRLRPHWSSHQATLYTHPEAAASSRSIRTTQSCTDDRKRSIHGMSASKPGCPTFFWADALPAASGMTGTTAHRSLPECRGRLPRRSQKESGCPFFHEPVYIPASKTGKTSGRSRRLRKLRSISSPSPPRPHIHWGSSEERYTCRYRVLTALIPDTSDKKSEG